MSKGNPRSGNSEVQYSKQIQWRRNKVLELLVKGAVNTILLPSLR
jgi:hypothetical protein